MPHECIWSSKGGVGAGKTFQEFYERVKSGEEQTMTDSNRSSKALLPSLPPIPLVYNVTGCGDQNTRFVVPEVLKHRGEMAKVIP